MGRNPVLLAGPLPVRYNTRAQLLKLGIGDFNATMICRFVFWSPAQTDPGMPAVILLTRAIQETLNRLGAGLDVTGIVDDDTAQVLDYVGGKGYLYRPWWELVNDVVGAKERGMNLRPLTTDHEAAPATSSSLSGFPDIPGGLFTVAAGAAALWYFLKR